MKDKTYNVCNEYETILVKIVQMMSKQKEDWLSKLLMKEFNDPTLYDKARTNPQEIIELFKREQIVIKEFPYENKVELWRGEKKLEELNTHLEFMV
jgi:hypothetical protein